MYICESWIMIISNFTLAWDKKHTYAENKIEKKGALSWDITSKYSKKNIQKNLKGDKDELLPEVNLQLTRLKENDYQSAAQMLLIKIILASNHFL